MHYAIFIVAVTLAAPSCKNSHLQGFSRPTSGNTAAVAAVPDTVAPELLRGKPMEEAIAIAGPADDATDFNMSAALPEFRIVLYNFFVKEDYRHKRIPVKELTWYNGERNITIWYREQNYTWVYITMTVWDKHTEF
ncbi:hypothetical protein [Chitinophaga sp. 212800010-3]|uniref:hypothetical protein n=1 Tax=unclassified Chitinophaga TaxID=2619133 RepID=UPI002DF5FECB|nr:hypothetical protein [Chitinophaga sp. 212800010-3]